MIHRREALMHLGQVGLGALTLAQLLARSSAASRSSRTTKPRAKSCIFLFLWGGPPQQDMWDVKLEAPSGIRSQFRASRTVVPGLDLCEHMPLIARQADKIAVIRSMSHSSNDHEVSIYRALTGQQDPGVAVPNHFRRRSQFPNVGAGVTHFSPPGRMPASITVPGPVSYSGISFAGTYSGFLGPRNDPVELSVPPKPDLRPASAFGPGPAMPAERMSARRGLLQNIEAQDRLLQAGAPVRGFDRSRERAFTLLSSSAAKDALDLERENARLRDRYGRNVYGDSFLLARRLIESGVRLVTVNWLHFPRGGGTINPWDNHGGSAIFGGISGYAMLTQWYCLPSLDRAYSALLEDLAARGLLDETVVVLTGEFGRTPKINTAGGRDHWGMCYSTVLAGGGVRGGQVHGASDRDAAYPKSRPVAPEDVLATIYSALGIPPESRIDDALSRPYRLCEGQPLAALF